MRQLTTTAQLRWVRAAFRLTAVGLASLHVWAAAVSHSMNADGISYLDMGDALWRGDWDAALNPVWSPLYPSLLGLVMRIVQPPSRWEFPVVHLVNLSVFFFALLCFEFFWRELSRYRQTVVSNNQITWPQWLWEGIGYALFLWSALALIEIWAVTPDMLMAGLVYLAAALTVGFRLHKDCWARYALFGAVLGIGYLAKAIMWPLSFIFLGVVLLSAQKIRRVIPRFLLALFTFGVVSGPFVAALSSTAGHFTFSESGTLTFIRYVNGIPYPHWQGEDERLGEPSHSSRQIFFEPPVYEFGTPVGGTYPISYDPSYWYEGAAPSYQARDWLPALISNLRFYVDLFLRDQAALIIGVILLYGLGRRSSIKVAEMFQRWGLVFPGLAALTAYSLVYVEGRYIGVFLVLIWADLLANASLPEGRVARRVFSLTGSITIFFLLLNLFLFNVDGFDSLAARQRTAPEAVVVRPPSWPGEVTEALQQEGVQAGTYVGVIGYGFDSYWARLGRWKIVAELPVDDAEPFWSGGEDLQGRVLDAFAGAGVEAIVAEHVPPYASLPGWQQVGDANYYIYVFTP